LNFDYTITKTERKMLNFEQLTDFLDEKALTYNKNYFIDTDPIQIPHQFKDKEDIEIAAFLTATIAWGRRDLIIKSAHKMMTLMGDKPKEFVLNFDMEKEAHFFSNFKHRTFNGSDLAYFIHSLRLLIIQHGSLEQAFAAGILPTDINMKNSLGNFHDLFFNADHSFAHHSKKHVANPLQGSAAKRLNMFLRWMVRKDEFGVDFGLWETISPSILSCPLDVHTGNVGRKLGLITRNQNDWKTVEELDGYLRLMDAKDPVKYDFALFGLGVFEGF